ncbi:HlyC/CorC family transporter [bacterium]|nr:HlyC/CorC family transporter [bacterium]
MFFEIIAVLLLVFANGFFVAAEFAIVKVRSTQIETLIQANDRRAKLAKDLITHLDAYLSATQLGITIASIGLGWIGEPAVSRMIQPLIDFIGVTNPQIIHAISFAVGFSIITFLHITLGELAPKSAAIQYPQSITLGIAFPLKLFYIVFKPFIFLLNGSANLMLRLVGINPAGEQLAHSEEEIRLLIADGRKSGVIDATEYKLIENIFNFTETTVKEIMVPRTEVFALDLANGFQENFKLAVESGFTRIPVFRDTIDTLVGVLYVKDLFKIDRQASGTDLEKILRPLYFAPETTSINRVMQDFMQQRVHMGIVIDEFGGTSGIVTMENILERIVGQIQDEYDEEKKDFESNSDGSFTVNAKMRIADFNQQFQSALPEDADYETLAGFLNDHFGHIPAVGESIEFQKLSFKVLKKTPKQIQQVRVVKI